jgi:hypothetical protein
VAVPAAIPGACADEDAAVEPVGSVIAVRGASVWIIRVIAIAADRCRVDDYGGWIANFRADTDSDGDLGVCCGHQSQRDRDQCHQNKRAQNTLHLKNLPAFF